MKFLSLKLLPRIPSLFHKMKMSGLQLGPDGNLHMMEFKGPPSFEMWAECYQILRTSLIFLDAAELGPLDAYLERIKGFAKQYGESLWHLVYQADSRMRREQMERLRRRGAEAKALDPNHAFDPASPWNWVWAAAEDDDKFWKRELEIRP